MFGFSFLMFFDNLGVRFGGHVRSKALPGGSLFPLHFLCHFRSRFGARLVPILDAFWLPFWTYCSSFLRMSKNLKNYDGSISGADFCLSKNISVESKTGLVLVSIWDCVLTGFWTVLAPFRLPFGTRGAHFANLLRAHFWIIFCNRFFMFVAPNMIPKVPAECSLLGGPKKHGVPEALQGIQGLLLDSPWATFGLPLASFLAS